MLENVTIIDCDIACERGRPLSSVICTRRNIVVKTLSALFKARESRTTVFREGTPEGEREGGVEREGGQGGRERGREKW